MKIFAKILVFGANGYIGRHVSKLLVNRRVSFVPADLQPTSADGHPGYVRVDLLNPATFEFLVPEASSIFLLAGLTGTVQGFAGFKSFVEINEMGLLFMLEAMRKCGSKAKLIFPSSRLVYRGRKNRALKEGDEKEFKTIYAMNKFAGEQYLDMYRNAFGLRYAVFRLCVPYGNLLGCGLSFGTISHMISKAEKGEDITLFGDGSQRRSLIHIEDLARILVDAGTNKKTDNGVFNLGGPDVLSIRQIAERIAKLYGVRVKRVPWPPEHLKIESGDTIFDSRKLEKMMKVRYRHDFASWAETLRKAETH